MAHHLKLLADNDFPEAISDWLRQAAPGRHKIVTAREKGWHDLDDDILIRRATEDDRILITEDQEFRRSKLFPICTHAGIIVFSPDMAEASDESKINRLKEFLLSGQRQRARHAIVTLEPGVIWIEDENGRAPLDIRKTKRPRRQRRRR